MKVINKSNNFVLADKAKYAKNFISRLVGLLNRSSLNKGEALVIVPSNCVHSFFMRFSIDVIFLDKSKKVVGFISDFKPFYLSPLYSKAYMTVELPAGVIVESNIQLNDVLEII